MSNFKSGSAVPLFPADPRIKSLFTFADLLKEKKQKSNIGHSRKSVRPPVLLNKKPGSAMSEKRSKSVLTRNIDLDAVNIERPYTQSSNQTRKKDSRLLKQGFATPESFVQKGVYANEKECLLPKNIYRQTE